MNSPPPAPISESKVAVVDLGFNSLKLICYRVDSRGDYRAYRVEDHKVRLGEDFDTTGVLARDAVERALQVLRLFKDILAMESIETILPLATSAVRDAANRQAFLETASEVTGLKLVSLTGDAEALLSYLGATVSTGVRSGVFFDIGGGSLEIVHAENFKIRKILSLPLGALRMTYEFARKDGTISGRDYDRLENHLRKVLPSRKSLGIREEAQLVGVGGTLRAMVRFHQQVTDYPLKKIHGYTLSYRAVDYIASEIRGRAIKELRRTGVLNKDRAQTITAGACVVEMLMRRLGFSTLTTSAQGLREGALLMFTRDRNDILGGKIDRSGVERVVSLAVADRERQGVPPVRLLASLGYLDEREQEILAKRNELWRGVHPTVDLDSLFSQLMSTDTSLSHPNQLLMSLAIIRSRNERITRRLSHTYETLLPKRYERTIKRLAAFHELMDFLRATQTEMSVNPVRDGISIDVSALRSPPEALMTLLAERVGSTTDIPVRYLLPHQKLPHGSPRRGKVAA